MDEIRDDPAVPTFGERFAGQVIGLFLWPLLTVVLVAGALYYDRVHNLNELTIQKETLLVRAVALFLESGHHAASTDLKQLLDDIDSLLAHSGYAALRGPEVADLLADTLAKHPLYEQVLLLEPNGREIARLRSGGNQEAAAFGTANRNADDRSALAAFFATSPGELQVSPPVLSLCRGAPCTTSKQRISVGLTSSADNGRAKPIAIIDYRMSVVYDLVSEIGTGERGTLMIFRDQGELAGALAGNQETGGGAARIAAVKRLLGGRDTTSLFLDGSLYSYTQFTLSALSTSGDRGETSPETTPEGRGAAVEHWSVVSEMPAGYFVAQKRSYLLFLAILALALLIPSFVVCLFWAKARVRARRETELRAIEQVEHLVRLEQEVRERTRELDDRNLQLSAEIAERLNAEIHLRQSNELFSGMVESIDGIIYVADFDTHEILYANTYLKKLFGFNPIGRKCWQFIHASGDGPCSFCVNNHLLGEDGEPTGPYQWEYQNPFNKRWYNAKDLAIRWSNGKYVKLEIAIDITEQKQLQHFLQEARRQAEIAQNMRSRFVALVAHDLKSPFYSITQMLKRILERETFSSEVHRQFLENIVTNGHRMLQMIDDLLSMDRFESAEVKLERTFFNATDMAAEVITNFNHLASEKSLHLINLLPLDCPVYADKYLYFVVLNNLLSNAIKFSQPGGTIEICQPDRSRPMIVAVRDYGKGMSPDYVENLFKVDVKTSSRGTIGEPGSGLGLLFCQDILKAHGGTLEVNSQLGSGSVFSVVVPECCPWQPLRGTDQGDDTGRGADD
ncbi:ATP-binding protein [Desulfofustis glycolicus]|uniref:histidine kinase n=1 Tax=Desulfofustis glycolicus DSM 9705 TaxID=1121409 RepID=A0A1M5V9Y4_9BACT|nr:ATP-binding protein [Desulfofustis glycolicus]SHH71723.1 PAS domain S-box-containing protein [Desulfofustis glycolicus DSM 9705]